MTGKNNNISLQRRHACSQFLLHVCLFYQLAISYQHKNVTCFVQETCIEEEFLDTQCDAYLSDAFKLHFTCLS